MEMSRNEGDDHHHHHGSRPRRSSGDQEEKVRVGTVDLSGMSLDSLPISSLNLSIVSKLDLSNNNLRLTMLPETIGFELICLKKLSVNSNKLILLPQSITHLTSLRVLDARLNCLRSLPDDMENLINLEVLNIGVFCENGTVWGLKPESMGLSGTIDAATLSALFRLRTLSFVNNNFNGPIPDFNNLTRLRSIYLSYNRFSGQIPGNALQGILRLSMMYLSKNRFSGRIPASLATLPKLLELKLDGNWFSGSNKDVCAAPLKACVSTRASPNRNVAPDFKKTISLWVILIHIIVGQQASKMEGSPSPPSYRKTETGLKEGTRASSVLSPRSRSGRKALEAVPKLTFLRDDDDVEKFDLPDLLKASAEILGSGCFGSSYKTALPNGTAMVVKRRDEKLLLVCDFAENGSLLVHLHALDWPTRLKIVKGVAKGLAYLYKELPSLIAPHGHLKRSPQRILRTPPHRLCSDLGRQSGECSNGKGSDEDEIATWVRSKVGDDVEGTLLTNMELFDKEMGAITYGDGKTMMQLLKIGLSCCEGDMQKRLDLKEAVVRIERLKPQIASRDDEFYSAMGDTGNYMNISNVNEEFSKAYKQHLEHQAREIFLPFRCFCSRKDITGNEVILEDTDVARALVDYISSVPIEIMKIRERGAYDYGLESGSRLLHRVRDRKRVDFIGSICCHFPSVKTRHASSGSTAAASTRLKGSTHGEKEAEEAALSLVEKEKAKCKVAVEAAQAAQMIAELEAQKRMIAEKNVSRDDEEGKLVAASHDIRYWSYTIQDIKVATDHFSLSRKIGGGGYGSVYRCYLDHTPVAIKVLRSDATQGELQFQQEVEVLSCIRHLNMVLLGACPEYCCLVYEYMDNGSLEDKLLRRNDTLACSSIVFDSVTQYHMTATVGTFCYIDPEYQQTGLLGIKYDVNSLGIMLLQKITAKSPMGLTHQVENAIENGTFADVLDPVVPDWPMDETLALAKLALKCSELRRKDRLDLGRAMLPELGLLRTL
ncbi:Kinase protein with adenine nucleotide alpha hydrolases-like domain, putative isoform 2 [Hibiscus syriacus]|uniref:RING-type E3 ubiquitin transferase n=1 Tax=Hibiscus syriacus TaxID=106335 RepID=A0A6A3D1Y4_HIBSY|nr:Kinase protein with adenine nucleotide alpha hydrolases-like domain, putative isoform 2 [Hibiscus syriacus]